MQPGIMSLKATNLIGSLTWRFFKVYNRLISVFVSLINQNDTGLKIFPSETGWTNCEKAGV